MEIQSGIMPRTKAVLTVLLRRVDLSLSPEQRLAALDEVLSRGFEMFSNEQPSSADLTLLADRVVLDYQTTALRLRNGNRLGIGLNAAWWMGVLFVVPGLGVETYVALRNRDLGLVGKALSVLEGGPREDLITEISQLIEVVEPVNPHYAEALKALLPGGEG